MVDKIEVLEDVRLAESQIDQGLVISHQEIKKKYSKKT